MYIIGIDIGKNNHEATIIDETGVIIGKSIKFTNSHSGANKLAVAHKLTHIIYAILRDNKDYKPMS